MEDDLREHVRVIIREELSAQNIPEPFVQALLGLFVGKTTLTELTQLAAIGGIK